MTDWSSNWSSHLLMAVLLLVPKLFIFVRDHHNGNKASNMLNNPYHQI